jgi:hypothetical protein
MGGPAIRAACGGNLGLPWWPRMVISHDYRIHVACRKVRLKARPAILLAGRDWLMRNTTGGGNEGRVYDEAV